MHNQSQKKQKMSNDSNQNAKSQEQKELKKEEQPTDTPNEKLNAAETNEEENSGEDDFRIL